MESTTPQALNPPTQKRPSIHHNFTMSFRPDLNQVLIPKPKDSLTPSQPNRKSSFTSMCPTSTLYSALPANDSIWTMRAGSPKQKKPHPRKDGASIICRRSPNLPHTYACSTIGPTRLNFRVRDGNGCDPRGKLTGKILKSRSRDLPQLNRLGVDVSTFRIRYLT
jgi:hypothetical protein